MNQTSVRTRGKLCRKWYCYCSNATEPALWLFPHSISISRLHLCKSSEICYTRTDDSLPTLLYLLPQLLSGLWQLSFCSSILIALFQVTPGLAAVNCRTNTSKIVMVPRCATTVLNMFKTIVAFPDLCRSSMVRPETWRCHHESVMDVSRLITIS